MIILGIETSCDETAAAVVKKENNKIEVLSSVVASSEALHKETGGIIPEVAAREQVRSIMPVIDKAMKIAASQTPRNDIDAIAVTYGPGLIGSLLVGVETAKTLSMVWKKPLIPVNHLVAHLAACFINTERHTDARDDNFPEFPAVGLVVSGGHTDFVYLTNQENGLNVKYIGGTRDDAAGEAFDKTARLIGLGYPGGPAISDAATKFQSANSKIQNFNLFPRPMINSGDLEMSFSGLKTSVFNHVNKNPDFDKNYLAAEIQEAIIDTLVSKSEAAIEQFKPKCFFLAGGVSANRLLREKLDKKIRSFEFTKLYVPEAKYSTDNAVMIAAYALLFGKTKDISEVNANPSLSIEH